MIETGVIVKEASGVIMNIVKGFDFIMNTEVLVGIPEEKSQRDGPLTNAQLMYLHTHGSPVNRIPPRPVIEPALSEHNTAERIKDHIIDGMKAALTGNLAKAQKDYEKAGMVGSNAAVNYITSGGLAPNAPITIEGGWMRNRSSGKPVYIKGKGSSQPLIDTGSLRQSITYVVRRKK